MMARRGGVNIASSFSSVSARTVPVMVLVEISTLHAPVLSAFVSASTTST